ncbi:transcription factor mef2A-like [Contarinia nasturtii]|uniref:transcription factor mef2A-like n=1 Tax=Contarinia nasturtii TaxID=265458 RepID=UPI0012D4B6C8|nr:transcription factor mef2A-like [Contarinia nasturtii]
MKPKLVTFVLIVICASIVISDARKGGGGRGKYTGGGKGKSSGGLLSSIFVSSKPKSSPSPTHNPYSSPITHHTSNTNSHNYGHNGGSHTFGSENSRAHYTPYNQNYVGRTQTTPLQTGHHFPLRNGHHTPIQTGHHTPTAPHLPSAPPAAQAGWFTQKNTGGSSNSPSGHRMSQNTHSGYGKSGHSYGWAPSVTATKIGQTSSSPQNYGNVGHTNYPGQQHHQTQSTSYHPQPNQPHHVTNNFVTHNHQTHYNPGYQSFSTPSVGYHFTTYHSYPAYYSPYPSYSPVSSFGLGLALGSSLGHHHHYHDYYGYPSTHHIYHHHDGNGNGNNNWQNGNNYNNNGNRNNPNNGDSNQNMQPKQNQSTIKDPTQPMAPLVYSVSGRTSSDDADSTEIIFTNPYLIVGVENMLMYGEFQDEQDITIIMEQDADGEDPYPWDPMYSLWYPNATSTNENQSNLTSVEQTTISIPMTTNVNTLSTTTIKTDIQSTAMPISTNTTTLVPLASYPAPQ